MRKCRLYIPLLIFSLFSALIQAQIQFSGLGRTVFQGTELSGQALQGDTLSDRIQQQGYALFDLRTHGKITDYFQFKIDTRIKNQLGGFGGVGLKASFRQIMVFGDLGRKWSYTIGDQDLIIPSLLENHKEQESLDGSGSTVFSFRQNVRQYENFNAYTAWRMRAAQVSGYFLDNRLETQVFVATDRKDAFLRKQAPIHLGAKARFENHKYQLTAAAIHHQLWSVPGTLSNISNALLKADVRLVDRLWVTAEGGPSTSSWSSDQALLRSRREDYFWKSEIRWSHLIEKPYITFLSRFQETGPFYENPGTQTQRISGDLRPGTLGLLNQNQQVRSQTLFDRIGEETLQNQNLSAFRQNPAPGYNPLLPYGPMSPNRRLWQLSGEGWIADFNVLGRFSAGSEVIGEGTPNRRRFQQGDVQVAYAGKKQGLDFLVRRTQTRRSGNFPIEARYWMLESRYNLDLSKYLRLMLGAKHFTSDGNEILVTYNNRNEVDQYQPLQLQQKEWLWGGGAQIFFSDNVFLYLSAYGTAVSGQEQSSKFSLNQWYTQFCYEF